MPRLSLYKEEKGLDYTFIDRQISEMFQVGGTTCYLHKYIGPKIPTEGTADQPIYNSIDIVNIQDLLFLENRDRKYDAEIYKIRGIYNVQNIDFNLSQFGIFIDNDTLFMTIHINDFIKYIGRKPISGDVLELPHLRDEFALNDYDFSLPRYYVIEDVGRASEGFSATWYPHLYRLKLKKVSNNQQFADIFNKPVGEDIDKFVGDYVNNTVYYPGQIVRINGELYQVRTDGIIDQKGTTLSPPDVQAWTLYNGPTLESLIGTRQRELTINDAILHQSEVDANQSGYETGHFWTLAVDQKTGKPIIELKSDGTEVLGIPVRSGYHGYLLGDGIPLNGYEFGHGIQFPVNPIKNDFFLRTDFFPNRLFQFDGTRWIKKEDNLRMTMTNVDSRQTQKTSFIDNTKFTYIGEVGFDAVNLNENDFIIDTNIDYMTAPYLVIKINHISLEYVTSEHQNLITSYVNSKNVEKVRITLPIIDDIQQVIPSTGTWLISLYSYRENQRQSISKALRPKADL